MRALTPRGGIAAAIVGVSIALCTPPLFPSLTVMVVVGIGATAVREYFDARRRIKRDPHVAVVGYASTINDRILRGAGSVIGNGGTAVLFAAAFGALNFLFSQEDPHAVLVYLDALYFATAGCIAAAAADTVAGEIGRAFRARAFSISTLKPVEIGANGGISALGTIAGCAASCLIGVVCAFFTAYGPFGSISHFSWTFAVLVAFSGVVGCFVDSFVGATIEGKAIKVLSFQGKTFAFTIGNNETNFISTLAGGAIAFIIFIFI